MSTLLTVFKAAVWGLLLLFFILISSVHFIFSIEKIEKVYPENFSQRINETAQNLKPALDELERVLIHEYLSSKKSNDTRKLVEDINSGIDKLCGDCGLKKFYTPTLSDLTDFRGRLDTLGTPDLIKHANLYRKISFVFSILFTLTTLYIIAALIVHRNSWQKLLLLVTVSFPLLLIFLGLSSLRPNERYLYLELGEGSINTWFIILGVAYFFVVYPVVYVLLGKSELSAKKTIFLKN